MITRICRIVLVCFITYICVVDSVMDSDHTIVWKLKTPVYLREKASMLCMIHEEDKPGHMAWTKAGQLIGINNASLYSTKYDVFIEYNRSTMMYHLVIKNIDIGDLDLVYKCESGFSSVEGILSLNEDTFIAKPQKDDITKNFTLKGGYLQAFVEVASVYPKPICNAEFQDRDITTYSKTNYTKKSLFYSMEFDLVYQTNECGNINISCVIGKKKLSILQLSHEFKEGCKHSNTNKSLSESEITLIIVGVIIVVVLFAVAVLIFRYLRRSENGNIENTVSDGNIPLLPNITSQGERLSTDERTEYIKALQTGTEVRRYVRIQVIGKDRVGKTSLVRRLLGKPIDDVSSTDGIEIDQTCQIRTSDGKWIISGVKTDKETIRRRLLRAINSNPEGKARIRHRSEAYVSKTEEKQGNHKRDPSQDSLLPTEINKHKTVPVDEHTPIQLNQQIRLAQTVGANVSATKNDNESLTKYTNECSCGLNYSIDSSNSIIRDTDDSELIELIKTPDNQNRSNSDYDYEITETMNENMDDFLLYAKNSQEKNTSDTSDGLVDCGIWDFAGKKDYYATHQTFLTPHAIYLLVVDITDDIKPMEYDGLFDICSCGEKTDFWLDSIHCLHAAFEDSAAKTIHPPVVMVCTGMDKVPDRNKEDRKTEYEQKIRDIFGYQEKSSHIRGMIHFISNTESPSEDFEILRKDISKIAHEMQYFAENLPTRWVQLEIALATMKAIKEKCNIGYCERLENIEKIAQKCLIEKDELLLFLNYQHKIGNVIFFYDQLNYIIFDPRWLVHCFRCLVCNDTKKHCTYTELCNLKNKGILSDHLLEELFSKEPELMFGKYKHHILDVMEKFNIIVKPKSTNSYYMPCMIENSSSLEDIKKAFHVTDSNCTPWLVLEFRFLPIGYFNHIMFQYINKYAVCEEKSTIGDGRPAIFAGKAVVYLDDTKLSRLIICLSRNTISLQIWKYMDVHDNTYRHIIEELCSIIERFETTLNHQLQYTIKSKCSTGDYCSSSDRLSYANIETLGERYWCEEHEEWHNKKDIEHTWLKHVPAIVNEKQAEMELKKTREKCKQQKEKPKISKSIKDKDIKLPWLVDDDEYRHMLSHGRYLSYENRLSLGGPYKAGKTTLANVLIGENNPMKWNSTAGLVIHFGRNGIDIKKKKMVRLIEDKSGHEVSAEILRGKQPILKTYEQLNKKGQKMSPDRTATPVQIYNSPSESPDTYTSLIKDTTHSTSHIAIQSHYAMTEYVEEYKGRHILNKAHGQITKIGQVDLQELQLSPDILNEVRNGRYQLEIAPSDLLDFGGPELYDITHQLCIQQRGSFLLMFDGRFGLHEQLNEYPQGVTASSILKHWVESILTYIGDTDDIMPKIMFAATHKDAFKDNIAKTKDNFRTDIEQMFSEHEKKNHIHLDTVYFINGLDEQDTEIQRIRDQVVKFATQQSSWGQRLPTQWVPLELQISNIRMKNINIITKEDIQNVNKLNGDLSVNARQLDDFLSIQHSLGKLMYYNLTGLDNFIIIHPPTLVNVLRSFVTDDILFPNDKTLNAILQNLTKTGKITKKELSKLWLQDHCLQYMVNDNIKEFIIRLLLHLDILIIPKEVTTDSDVYLVPCMMKTRRPPDFLSLKNQAERTINIRYALNRHSIPAALAYKVIGATLNAWPLKYDDQKRPCLYQKAVVVNVSKHNELRVFIEDNRVMVYLTNKDSLLSMSPDIAASVQECLTKNLEAAILFHYNSCGEKIDSNEVSEKYTMELGFPCGNDLCFISSKGIQKTRSWVCQKGIEHHTKYLLYWTFNTEQTSCGAECKGMTEKDLKTEPSEKHLVRLAKFIGVNSSTTFLNQLGVDKTKWEEIKYKYASHSFAGILSIALIKWKQLSQKPTLRDLSDALASVNSNTHLICQVFRENLKSLDFTNINLQIMPSVELLEELSNHIGNCPIQLGIELGLSLAEVEESLASFQKDLFGLNKDILFKWRAKANVKTIHTLILSLKQVNSGGLHYLMNKLKITN